jgi:hypothetical protein
MLFISEIKILARYVQLISPRQGTLLLTADSFMPVRGKCSQAIKAVVLKQTMGL